MVEGKNTGRLEEIRDMGKNEGKWRTQGVSKQDGYSCKFSITEVERENWKLGKRWQGRERS